LAPNTLSAPPTAELRKILGLAAHEMLIVFLRKSRTRRTVARGMGVGCTGHPVDVVSPHLFSKKILQNDEVYLKAVDTVLVKLYAQFEKTKELLTLLQEPNDVSLSEVEPVLQATGQYNALCLLYKQLGEDLKLLESWAK
jgi:vacuolar protein sorting-associated protein 3